MSLGQGPSGPLELCLLFILSIFFGYVFDFWTVTISYLKNLKLIFEGETSLDFIYHPLK